MSKLQRIFLVAITLSLSITLRAEDAQPSKQVLHKFSKFDSVFDDAERDASRTREQDPLRFISKDMKGVVGDLSQYETGKPTQAKEQQVIGQLDDVIKLLEQQCKNGKPGGNLNPNKPMPDSKLGGGPGGIHELTDPKASEKQWGNLSPKQRDQILQSQTDGFPPGYESLLQSYYKRLASEQVNDASDATTQPSGK
ncbi:MAG TPA: hypothetical protein VHS31_19840 [Tepidisphaeraceae bacterium]|jgi:hypothetical protein|nr:hypothetical protein [Tepidisphaeraceae bacterium]